MEVDNVECQNLDGGMLMMLIVERFWMVIEDWKDILN